MSNLLQGTGLYLRDMADYYDRQQEFEQARYKQGRQEIADQRADEQYSNRQAAASLYAGGDHAGARQVLTEQGDYDALTSLDTLDDHQRKQAADEAEFLGRLTPALAQIDGSDGGALRREAARQMLRQRGLSDQEIDGHDFSDRGLEVANSASMSIKDRLAERRADLAENKPLLAQDGAVLQPDGQGGYQTIYTPGTKPLTQVVTDPVTGDVRVVQVPGSPGQSSGGSSGQARSGDASNGTRAARNNNPGNLRWDGKSKWQGMTDVDDDGFVVFDTPANGQRALGINIGNQQRLHGINTVSDFITKYAPPKDGNDTQAYIGTVARSLGVGPNDRIDFTDPQVQQVLAGTITGVESGGTPAKFNNQPQGQPSAQAGGPTITNLGGGSGGTLWQDTVRNGREGQENTRTGEFKPYAGQAGGTNKPLTEKDVAAASQKLAQVRRMRGQVQQLQKLDDNIYGGFIGGRLPGNLVGGDTDRFDTLVSNIRNTVTAITRIPGIGTQSNYEAQLAAATMPERVRSKEGRAQAYKELLSLAADMDRELSNQVQGRIGAAPQPAAPRPAATSRQPAPAGRGQPRVGQVVSRNGRSFEWTGSTWRAR